jgi:hypothetical protein
VVRLWIRRLRWPLGILTIAAAVVGGMLAWSGPERSIDSFCQVSSSGGAYRLDLEQAANATMIAVTAKELGLPDHAVTVAIEAALQESRLHNINYGDRDSLGLFQQRPSQGWGTPAQILDTRYAARKFLEHLAAVPNWATRSVDDAAQAVQRSAAPDAYTRWETVARAVASAITGERPAGLGCQFPVSGKAVERSVVDRAILEEWGHTPLGQPLAPRRGWMVAAWMVANSHRLGIRSVTFSGRRWSSSAHSWSPYPMTDSSVHVATET